MKSKADKTTLGWIYKSSKRFIPAILVCTLLSAITSVAYVVLAYVSSFVIDIAIGKKQGNIEFFIVLLFALILMQAILNIFVNWYTVRVSGKLRMGFRSQFFKSLMQKEYRSISAYHSGDILNRFTSDIEVIVSAIVGVVPGVVSFIARLIAAFIVLLSLSRNLGLAVAFAGIVIVIIARIYSRFIKNIHKSVQQAEGETRSYMQECTENMVVVKSFRSVETFGEVLKDLMKRTYNLQIKRSIISTLSNSTKYIIFTGGYYVALCAGAFMISGGTLSYGTLTALLNIISNIRRPLTAMSGFLPQYYQALASAERIMEIESLTDDPKPLKDSEISEIYKSLKCIEFNDVSFSYDGKRSVLENLNMQLNNGEMIALVGGSGEGKSTLFRMLLGLYKPTSGSISAVGNSRIKIDPKLRGLFAYVPQGNLILSGTIASNIRFCNTEATDSEVIKAAEIADLKDLLTELPDGINTVIGEHGIGLSQGQLQRISIARAILCNAPILLLDECTSALDQDTENRVLCNIKESKRTAILISHRPAALKICDKVYSIEHGVATEK